MNTYSLFNAATGVFSTGRISASDRRVIEANIPEGMAAIEGVYDHLSQRVDVESIVDDPVKALAMPDTGMRPSESAIALFGGGTFSKRAAVFAPDAAPVIDYIPPSPGDDYEWIQDDSQGNRVRRWLKKPEVAEREQSEASAMAKIIEIETESQPRAVREALIALAGKDNAAVARLVAIDDEIAMQRADLSPAIRALPSVP